jgi:hypothetical protein
MVADLSDLCFIQEEYENLTEAAATALSGTKTCDVLHAAGDPAAAIMTTNSKSTVKFAPSIANNAGEETSGKVYCNRLYNR